MTADNPGSVTNVQAAVSYRDATAADAATLGRFMYEHLPWARIRDFGVPFLILVHRALCTSKHAVCRVAETDGRLLGYCAGMFDPRRFHREFLWKHGWKAALLVVPCLFRPKNWEVLWKGLTYVDDDASGDPPQEIIGFSVDPNVKGTGVGKALFAQTMAALKAPAA